MNPPSKHHNGMTQLECKWKTHALQVPAHEAEVDLVRENIVIITFYANCVLYLMTSFF